MTRYVLGFAFDDRGDNVVLIQKTKPAWQAGKFNGLGGKIEAWETAPEAMIREFFEEAGVMTLPGNWTWLGDLRGPNWEVVLYYAFNSFLVRKAETKTEEEVCTFSVQALPETISNVPWLIAVARNHRAGGGEFTLEAKYV